MEYRMENMENPDDFEIFRSRLALVTHLESAEAFREGSSTEIVALIHGLEENGVSYIQGKTGEVSFLGSGYVNYVVTSQDADKIEQAREKANKAYIDTWIANDA